MGVKDLVGWISKHHPEVIKSFPARWDAPDIRGKRVALDATLLTNRFHMADRHGKFNGKAALLGWHGLLVDMKQSGVQPIAVWDERGVREWKAPEARRRQASRATVLARKLHEDRRARRLSKLGHELKYAAMFIEPASHIWRKTQFAPVQRDRPRDEQSHCPATLFLDLSDTAVVLHILYVSVFATHIDSLRRLHAECVEEMTRASREPAESNDKDDSDRPPRLTIEEEDDSDAIAEDDASSDQADAVRDAAVAAQEDFSPIGAEEEKSSDINEEDNASDIAEEDSTFDIAEEDSIPPIAEEDSISATIRKDSASDTFEEDDTVEEDITSDIIEDAVITDEQPDDSVKMDATDRMLASIAPRTDYVETPRQVALSESEIELYTLLFDTEEAPLGISEIIELGQQTLQDLISRAKEVRRTYVGSLNVPREKDHADCRELLQVMGVPIVIARIPYEAEGLASALVQRGIVDYVGSEDSDVVVYGVPLLRNLANASQPLTRLESAALREKLGWTADRFIDFCILLGTDASPRIAKVGPATAFGFMKTYASIEDMLQNELAVADRLQEPEEYFSRVLNARNLFTDLPPEEDVVAAELTFSEIGVKKWLWREHRVWPRRGAQAEDLGEVRLEKEEQSVPIELLEVEIEEILDQELRKANDTPPAVPFTDTEIEEEMERELLRSLPNYLEDT